MKKFKIGLRTIKTAIAVFFCLLIHYVCRTETGLLSCIAAVVCMRETVGKSLQMGLHRFLGTLIGGALGYVLVLFAQNMPHYQDGIYVIIIPLGMIICIWLCTLIDKKNGVIISCVVFISIGLEPSLDKAMTLYNVFLRITDTTVGIIVAGLVNRYFFPYYENVDTAAAAKPQEPMERAEAEKAQVAEATAAPVMGEAAPASEETKAAENTADPETPQQAGESEVKAGTEIAKLTQEEPKRK